MIKKNRTLYLGIDPSKWTSENEIVHYPVIRTELILGGELKLALEKWPEFTHVIFTSRSTVRHLWEVAPPFEGKVAIAIGEGTAKELQARGVNPIVAEEAHQEGVIELLKKLDLKGAYLFLPHSKRARPQLKGFLRESGIHFLPLELYDTLFQAPAPIPILEEFTEVVFTSPSTVEAFIEIYKTFPAHLIYSSIGMVTDSFLKKYV